MQSKILIETSDAGYSATFPDLEGRRIQSDSLDEVIDAVKDKIKTHLAQTSAEEATGQSILSMIDNIFGDMTEEEASALPKDGSEQHDHYIYGTPKRTE